MLLSTSRRGRGIYSVTRKLELTLNPSDLSPKKWVQYKIVEPGLNHEPQFSLSRGVYTARGNVGTGSHPAGPWQGAVGHSVLWQIEHGQWHRCWR